ncbi:Gfo/Idh/MocA family oxidoreductase, partial [uncultured Deinococcus sp.]|uniref:Gfo/Idh/MocA family oxidoreductase n=1 Tax=uncultured Deinococcus sp. TaxID=158789 RepID=UPI003749F5AE
DPNVLIFDRLDQPRQILTRGGPGLGQSAQAATRLPAGHPEAFIEAFGNIYRDFAAHVRAQTAGKAHSPAYPTIADGVRGVEFVEAAIESASSGSWVNLPR